VVAWLGDEERYTFSSLMTLLIDSQRKLKDLYERTSKETDDASLKSLLSQLGRRSSVRIDKIQRARIESVVEIALEPVTGLKLSTTLARITSTIGDQSTSSLEKLATLENAVSELYAKASPKIAQISADTSELLSALSRESLERSNEITKFLSRRSKEPPQLFSPMKRTKPPTVRGT